MTALRPIPTRPTPLTPDQARRLRVADTLMLAATAALVPAHLALTLGTLPRWIVLPVGLALYAPGLVRTRRLRTELGLTRQDPLIPPYPAVVRHCLATAAPSVTGGVIMYDLLIGDGPDAFMLCFLLGVGPAIALWWASQISFVPTPPSCPACGYALSGLAYPLTCPECAAPVASEREALTCRRVHARRFRAAAVACVLLPMAFATTLLFRPGIVTARLPRPARMALAASDTAAFHSLLGDLTPDERARLADRLLAARPRSDQWELTDQLEWLGAELAAGRLSSEQADRFASDGWRFEIASDQAGRVGRPMTIGIIGETPMFSDFTATLWYLTRGIEIDGRLFEIPPQPRRKASLATPATRLAEAAPLLPVVSYTPQRPGTVYVTAEILAFSVPGIAQPSAIWDPDEGWKIEPPPLTAHSFQAEAALTISE